MATRRSILLTAAALIATSTALQLPSSPVSAAWYTMTVVSPVEGRIGIDAVYPDGIGDAQYDVRTCTAGNEPTLGWNSAGQLEGTSSVPSYIPGRGALQKARFEMYPGACGHYSPWADVGGVHIEAPASGGNLGQIRMPVLGQGGAFRIDGDIISSTPITEGRVNVDTFQVPTVFPDPPAPLQSNGIVQYGAFATGRSVGDKWTGSVGWPGWYILYVTDTATNRLAIVWTPISPGAVPTIDLDAVCFGFEMCTQSAGSPPAVPGEFYPLTPTRILDTRVGLGITSGAVRTGDGSLQEPNPIFRRAEADNHELKVTGRFGVPESGVSAVLLNVTAVGAPGSGFLSVVPKPARVGNVFDDQASFSGLPATSNLNVDGPDAAPNMVLARVGAGGKIRITNSYGPTHVIADIAGWFGTAGRYDDGTGFEGVAPARLLDSRIGLGGPATRFRPWETRYLKVAGVAGIPANAESVVVNLTSVDPDQDGSYITAFPKGSPVPVASNVNGTTHGVRANLAVVKVGVDGKIGLHAGLSGTHLIVDVMGSFGPYGGAVTTVDPVRSIDSRTGVGTEWRWLDPGETRTLQLRGRAGVPNNAKAVIVNVTATGSNWGGFFTLYPTGTPRPTVSNLNFAVGQTVPNLAMLKLGPDGAIEVYNDRGVTHIIVDVMGYIT